MDKSSNSNEVIYNLLSIKLLPEYNTEENTIVNELYEPCLLNSVKYDRAVGYFRSSIYMELGEQLLDFAIRGGKIRLVCSPDIPEKDENAAKSGYELRGIVDSLDMENLLRKLIKNMSEDPDESDCLEMLRLLIQNRSLDLYIALRTGGIYHRKVGRFTDAAGNYVIFSGSGNETQSALGIPEFWGNDEEFDVFRSWGEDFERKKAENKSRYIDKLFSGGTRNTEIVLINDVARKLLEQFRRFDDIEQCRPGASRRSSIFKKGPMKKPYYYQKQAIEAWEEAGRIGILSMATGTGKTITSLFAIKPLMYEGFPILILVPTKEIMDQWQKEINSQFPEVPVLYAGGGHDWKNVPNKRIFVSNIERPKIILSTMDTASKRDFLEFISQSDKLVLVADEVHRLGSETRRSILGLNFSAMLGLSATPERLFDEIGNRSIVNAFGQEPVYSLPIDASVRMDHDREEVVPILGKFLSRYYYNFKTINLTEQEQKQWDAITDRIKKYIAAMKSDPKDHNDRELVGNNTLKMLLIQRSRIIKAAREKINVANEIISEFYPNGGRWLIYCDNKAQMDEVWENLKTSNLNIPIMRYYSDMSYDERRLALANFEETPSIMVSMKCLDEGVDIPSADGAIILASSSNPREYIQRRGRVLRKHIGKGDVQIIDVIVLPSQKSDNSQFSIVRNEISRAYSFAECSINKEVTHRLWRIVQEYNALEEYSQYSIDDEVD